MAPMRLLQYDAASVPDGGRQVVCSLAGPVTISHKEPAGHLFHLFILKQNGFWDEPAPEGAEDDTADQSKDTPSRTSSQSLDEQPPPGVDWKGSKKKKKSKRSKEADLYALLGLQNERWTATDQQIKMGYRKVCLEAHPDKALVGVTDEAEQERIVEKFKTIQDAYETLSDPAKRREYDSTDDFDDSLPTSCDPKDFFKVFAPAFKRNARWSVDTKVPDLGGPEDAWEAVDKFYDFWLRFRSWREFPHPDEEDVEQAESREHRRWIDRLNSKLREKGKKEEQRRLREFVEAAFKLDPRVVAKKEADRAERERKKQEKEDAKRRAQEEEEARKAAEEAAKKVAEEAAKKAAMEGKKNKEAAKQALKRQRQRLRAISNATDTVRRLTDYDAVEKLCAKLDTAALTALNDALEAAASQSRDVQEEVLCDRLSVLEMEEAEEEAARLAKKREAEVALKDMAKRDHSEKMKRMQEWTDEELRMLDKAVNKFPQGTPKRWEAVAAYIRTRPLDEVLLMVKERQGASATRLRQQEDWKGAQKKAAEVRSAADTRANAFTDVDVSLQGAAATLLNGAAAAGAAAAATAATNGTAAKPPPAAAAAAAATTAAAAAAKLQDAAVAAAKPKAAAVAAAKPQAAAAAAAKPKAAAAAAAAKPQAAAATPKAPAASTAPAAPEPAAAAAAPAAAAKEAPKVVVSSSTGEWTEEQELALVQALKQYGKELEDRWDRIAAVVPGKSKGQCFKRFKELRDAFRGKK